MPDAATFAAELSIPEWRDAELITRSLCERPGDWDVDGFRATHRCGVSVWHANEAYGLHVAIRGSNSDARWTPGFFARRRIWRAVRQLRRVYLSQGEMLVRRTVRHTLAEG